jgi:hypothetical protein
MKERYVMAFVAAGALACSDVPSPVSSDMSTRDMQIRLTVNGTPLETRVVGGLTSPSSDLRLVDGDRLVLVTDTFETGIGNGTSTFEATLPPFGGNLVVRLERPPGRGGNTEVRAELAAPFAVVGPVGARISEAITLTWTGTPTPNGTTSLAVTGPCVGSQARVLATDTGEYRFNPAELETRTTKGPCTVAAKIVRTSGSATQTATTTFEVTP